MFYFTFSLVISAWISLQSFPNVELTSFASAALLSLLPGAPVSEDGQSFVQGGWGKKVVEQQTEAVCPLLYKDRSLLISYPCNHNI